MAPPPNRRELVLDNGKVLVEVPQLMTDDELVAVFERFIAEVRGRVAERVQTTPKGPAEPPEPPKGSPLPPHRYPKKRR
jgi:hypothetical protein